MGSAIQHLSLHPSRVHRAACDARRRSARWVPDEAQRRAAAGGAPRVALAPRHHLGEGHELLGGVSA